MFKMIDRKATRVRRHDRSRKKLAGTAERPRLAVYRSHKNLFLQLIDDSENKTLFAYSTLHEKFRTSNKKKTGGNLDSAKKLGALAAEEMKGKGFQKIAFDRGGYMYHGRIKALADALREGGIQF